MAQNSESTASESNRSDSERKIYDGTTLNILLAKVLKTLTYREREILKLRFGIGDSYSYTLEECGKIFKVTRERIRQVEAKAIRKLRHPVRAIKVRAALGDKHPLVDKWRIPKTDETSRETHLARLEELAHYLSLKQGAKAKHLGESVRWLIEREKARELSR